MSGLYAGRVDRPGHFDQADGTAIFSNVERTRDLLVLLDQAVPVYFADIRRWGPDRRIAAAREAFGAVTAGEKGGSGFAEMIFGGRSEVKELNALALALAVMAHNPGGVTFATRHWCTDHAACLHAEQLARKEVPDRA